MCIPVEEEGALSGLDASLGPTPGASSGLMRPTEPFGCCLSGGAQRSPCSVPCRGVSTGSSSSEPAPESALIAWACPGREWTDSRPLDRLQWEMRGPLQLLAEHPPPADGPGCAGVQQASRGGRDRFPPGPSASEPVLPTAGGVPPQPGKLSCPRPWGFMRVLVTGVRGQSRSQRVEGSGARCLLAFPGG